MTRLLPFFLAFLLPPAIVLGVELGGWWTLVTLVVVFGLIPLLDRVVGVDTTNPSDHEPHRWWFDIPLFAWLPLQAAATVWVLARLTGGTFSVGETVAIVITLGVVNGAGGINIAHELMHRKQPRYRAAAELLMSSVHYTHFCVEHVLGHHRHVATEHDPASSHFGESVYQFVPRSVLASLVSAWRIERARCARLGIGRYDVRDRRFRYAVELVVLDLSVLLAFGGLGLALFIAHGAVAVALLETINYIEHYGLERERLDSGGYERVRPQHSWNSAHQVSNWFLFNLQRHSDHHYLASREYDRLRHYQDVPQLPAGYATMVIVALFPRWWFRLMNPRVREWSDRRADLGASAGG